MPKADACTMQSTHPKVFFGGDAAFGPKNIIWAVACTAMMPPSPLTSLCQGEGCEPATAADGQPIQPENGHP